MTGILRPLGYVIAVLLLLALGLVGGILAAQRGLLGLLGVGEPSIRISIVLEQIQSLAQLTTTRYNFSSIVTSEREMPPVLAAIYGDRQLLYAVGYVDAGVDLGQLDEDDLTIADGQLSIVLPAAMLQSCSLDESQTYVMERETGIFAPEAPQLDSEARRFAIAQFRDQAVENGILRQAEDEARVVITQLLLAANQAVERVVVTFAPAVSGSSLPQDCR